MSDMAPDPATNSAPLQPVDKLAEADLDLDGPDDQYEMTEDPLEDDARPDPDEKPLDPPADPPKDPPAAPPAAEEPDDKKVTAEIPPEIKQQSEMFGEFDQALRENPVEVAAAIFDNMDARQKAAYLKAIGAQEPDSKYPEFKVDEYEAQGEMEEQLKARWNDLDAIPQVIRETRQLDGRIGEVQDDFKQAFQGLIPHVSESNVMSELALAKIDAICEALNIQLPDPDFEALAKEIKPGVKYRDAVRKFVNYGTAVELAKQANVKRPKDTANETRREVSKFDPDTDDLAVKIARQQGTLGRR